MPRSVDFAYKEVKVNPPATRNSSQSNLCAYPCYYYFQHAQALRPPMILLHTTTDHATMSSMTQQPDRFLPKVQQPLNCLAAPIPTTTFTVPQTRTPRLKAHHYWRTSHRSKERNRLYLMIKAHLVGKFCPPMHSLIVVPWDHPDLRKANNRTLDTSHNNFD
jgi:hypothetical protein